MIVTSIFFVKLPSLHKYMGIINRKFKNKSVYYLKTLPIVFSSLKFNTFEGIIIKHSLYIQHRSGLKLLFLHVS